MSHNNAWQYLFCESQTLITESIQVGVGTIVHTQHTPDSCIANISIDCHV